MFEDIVKKYINFKNITFCIVALLFIFFVVKCKDIAMLFFASFVIACSLNPVVDKLSKKCSRKLATFIVMTGVLAIILGIFIPLFAVAFEQIRILLTKIPNYIDNFDEYMFSLPVLKHLQFLGNNADSFMEQISMTSAELLTHVFDIGKYLTHVFMYFLISVIIIFNLIEDKENIKSYCLRIFPSNIRKQVKEIGNIITNRMGGYLIATLGASLGVGIVMLAGLFILKIPYASLLSVICAVFDIIPIIGPTIAVILCVIILYEIGTKAVISVLIIFGIAQLLENNIIRPYLFSKVMNVHPIIIFLFLFLTAEYIGILGVIFAPAIAALVSILFEELYLKKIN